MSDILGELYQTAISRRAEPLEGSYTCYLFDKGLDKILKKVGEECTETVVAAKNFEADSENSEKKSDLIGEISDLYYHLAVMMAQLGVTPSEVDAELERRALKTGNLKKFHVTDKNS